MLKSVGFSATQYTDIFDINRVISSHYFDNVSYFFQCYERQQQQKHVLQYKHCRTTPTLNQVCGFSSSLSQQATK